MIQSINQFIFLGVFLTTMFKYMYFFILPSLMTAKAVSHMYYAATGKPANVLERKISVSLFCLAKLVFEVLGRTLVGQVGK